MPIPITMPRLSDTMEEGTLIKWRVGMGDSVASGDILAEVETDKATMELQSYDDGTVALLNVNEDETAPVGQLILLLAEEGESADEAVARAKESGALGGGNGAGTNGGESSPVTAEAEGPIDPGRIRVSPVARKIAEENNLDIARIRGTGPDGRIIKRDVKKALSGQPSGSRSSSKPVQTQTVAPSPVPATESEIPLATSLEARTISVSSRRKTIARRLAESKATIPHFTVTVAIDAAPLREVRKQVNNVLVPQGIKLSVNDFIVRAAAMSLLRHPSINSSWSEAAGNVNIVQHGTVNIGIAVAIPPEKGGGLVVPVIRNTHLKSVNQISAETKELATKARGDGLTVEEMSDGTLTISNLGMFGVDHFEAIINPPQSAILAIGAAVDKPVVRDGQLAVGCEMTCTMSCDHRVIDGAMAAEFLQTLRFMLESPAALLV